MINDHKAYAQREKFYMQGQLYPDVKVGMTKVNLTPTVTRDDDGKIHMEPNAPVYIYDTSGPYTDPNYTVDLKKGLPRMRQQWIADRAKKGQGITQMACAKAGIITPDAIDRRIRQDLRTMRRDACRDAELWPTAGLEYLDGTTIDAEVDIMRQFTRKNIQRLDSLIAE